MPQIYRFFLKNTILDNLRSQEIFELNEKNEPEIFYQLTKVLRVRVGDKIVLLNQAYNQPFFDNYFFADMIAPKKLSLKFEKKIKNENELPFELGLVLSLPNKPDKLTFILQKATELGVKKITLVEADFSQFRHSLNIERLKKILMEAAEQSERAQIPFLDVQKKLKNYLLNVKTNEKSHLLVATSSFHSPQNAFKKAGNFSEYLKRGNLDVLIGPEGGFSPQEKEIIAQMQLPCFSLGKRILRMETAVILSLGLAVLSP